MSKEQWKTIPDADVRHVWRYPGTDDVVFVDPTFYTECGTPIDDETGDDLEYVETQIRVSP